MRRTARTRRVAGRAAACRRRETMMSRLRLTIQMVPGPIAGMSLCEALQGANLHRWRRLRRGVIAAVGGRCAVCGSRGRLYCHEKWQYLDKSGVARLRGFEALCRLCHVVRHGDAGLGCMLTGDCAKSRTFKEMAAHFCRVNRCSRARWRRYAAAAIRLWGRRSGRAWRVDLSRWAALVPTERRRGRWLLPTERQRRNANRWMTDVRRAAKLLKSEALAARLGVTAGTVRSWVRHGLIPYLRAGKRPLLFDLEAVLEALRRRGRTVVERLRDAREAPSSDLITYRAAR